MASSARINWVEPRKRTNVDGTTLPSNTPVGLISRDHLATPQEYVVSRVFPKPFWKIWGARTSEVTRLRAIEDPDRPGDLGVSCYSESLWSLPVPPKQSGSATFLARTDTGDASSGELRSAYLWLEELSRRGGAEALVGASVNGPAVTIGPKLQASRGFEQHWRVRVAIDPWVEISLLQGEAVLEHLRLLEAEYDEITSEEEDEYDGELIFHSHRGMRNPPSDTATYFVDRPLGETSVTCRLEPGDPLDVAVRIPDAEDLKAAFCLRIRNLEDDSITTTSPVFLTHVRDRLVATDLTTGLLRDEPLGLLRALDDARLDVGRLAERRRASREDTWHELVMATAELGATSVSEAAYFVAEGEPVLAFSR